VSILAVACFRRAVEQERATWIWGLALLGSRRLVGGIPFQRGNALLDSVQIVCEYDEEGQEEEPIHGDSEDAEKGENHRDSVAAPWALSAHGRQLLTTR